MKRILMLVVMLGALFAAGAAGFNARQEALITAIEKNLKSQNYSVERQDDRLKFKSEGATYYIEVDKDETNPMFVRMYRNVRFDDNIKRDKVKKKLNELNKYFTVKVYCMEKNLVMTSEMFVTSAEQFNYGFNDMLAMLKKVYSNIEK